MVLAESPNLHVESSRSAGAGAQVSEIPCSPHEAGTRLFTSEHVLAPSQQSKYARTGSDFMSSVKHSRPSAQAGYGCTRVCHACAGYHPPAFPPERTRCYLMLPSVSHPVGYRIGGAGWSGVPRGRSPGTLPDTCAWAPTCLLVIARATGRRRACTQYLRASPD